MAKKNNKLRKRDWFLTSAGGAAGYGIGEEIAHALIKTKKLKLLGKIGGAVGGTLLGTLLGRQISKHASDPKERLLLNLIGEEKTAAWLRKPVAAAAASRFGASKPTVRELFRGMKKLSPEGPGLLDRAKKGITKLLKKKPPARAKILNVA